MSFPRLADVVTVLDEMYPPQTAHDWDSVGLISGDPDAEVRLVHFAVDPVIDVVREAVRARADLLVTHHPLLLRGVKSVAWTSAKGETITRAIRGGTALFNAHTNADDASPGVSDALARTLGLEDLRPLVPAPTDPRPAGSYLVATTVPHDAVDPVLDAAAAAGGGAIGEYSRCAFTARGEGTFEPSAQARPVVGEPGVRESAPETRLEFQVAGPQLGAVVAAVRAAHPYEEPVVWTTELCDPAPGASTLGSVRIDDGGAAAAPSARGTGRIGRLAQPVSLERFAMHVGEALPFTPQGIRVAGDPDALVQTVAVCGGSGDSLFEQVRAAGVDVFLTADLRHHPASEAREEARQGTPFLVDVAHWASEWPWLHSCASRLQTALADRGFEIEAKVSDHRTDPWTFRVPSSGGVVR